VHGDKRGEGLRISDRSIEQVREAANIVEVASEFTALRRQGTRFVGLCPYPEHSEKTPSFSVSPNQGFYYCFGCQRGGDAIKLVSELKSFSFVDAVSYLAERSGVEIEFEGRGDPEAARDRNVRRRNIHKALAAAAVYYHKYLLKARSSEAELARRYLKGRGLEFSTIEEFRVGYAPPRGVGGFAGVAARLGIERKILDAAGLVSAGGRERFAGRITFPISDRRGRIVGFGARALGDDHPKYLNSPETEIFNKRDLLYGFPQVSEAMRKERAAIIVEGYTDVLMLYQSGIKNAVATLGTATTPSHLRALSGYADKIYMLFDPDTAGEKALERADATARELEGADDPYTVATVTRLKLDLRVLRLTEDPADWLLRHPPEEFAEMLSGAVTLLEYIFRRKVERARGASAAERSRMLSEVRGLIRRIDDPVFYREALRVAAEAMGVSPQELESGRREQFVRTTPSRHAASASPLEQAGQELLALMLARTDLATKALRNGVQIPGLHEPVTLQAEDFGNEMQAHLFSILVQHSGDDISAVFSDQRVRSLMDQVGALASEGERLFSSPNSFKAAWLRLAVLSHEKALRNAKNLNPSVEADTDSEMWMQLYKELQILKEALYTVSVEP
jgi:DNA primase